MRILAAGGLLLAAAVTLGAQSRPPRHTVLIGDQVLRYQEVDGMAVAEGDILLGTAAEIEAAAAGKPLPRGASIYLNSLGQPNNWPDGVMYYEIAAGFPNPQRVLDAIEHWNSRTPLKIVPRTGQPNFVRFVTGSGCSSFLGMIGGAQTIQLASGCSTGSVVHEIGHAFGLMHEQARLDRDTWLTVKYENIDSTAFSQYHQRRLSRDQGYYDYGSIMHYSRVGFSIDGRSTLETVPPGIPIGQSNGLSAGDIDAVTRLYGFTPQQTTITTIPEGLAIVVDGTRYTAPQAFSWAPGTVHTLEVDPEQLSGPQTAPVRNRFARWSNGGPRAQTFTASAEETVVAAMFQQSFRLTTGVSSGTGAVRVEPPSPDGYYLAGSRVRIQAIPGPGQALYSWTGNNPESFFQGFSAETLDIEVRQTLSFRALFRAAELLTTIDSSPGGTQVTVDGVPYYTPVRFQWAAGTTHSLAVTSPQYNYSDTSQYRFAGWEDDTLAATRTITVGATPQTFLARFNTDFYLDYDWTGGGSIQVSPPGSDYIPAGATVTLTARPSGNNTLQYWVGDRIGGQSLTQTFVMDRPRYARAAFGPALNFRTTNAGSYAANTNFDDPGTFIAPLSLVALFGSQVGPATLAMGALDNLGRLSSTVSNTRVLFNGIPAPLVYASSGQTVAVVPAEVASSSFAVITVERDGVTTGIATASVTPSLPGIFTADASGTGQIAMYNEEGAINAPAAPGTVITFYATGAGLWERAVANGAVMDLNLTRPRLPVYVRIGGLPAAVEYAGSAPFLVNGVLQVNVRIPEGLPPGDHAVRLIVGAAASAPGPTVRVR